MACGINVVGAVVRRNIISINMVNKHTMARTGRIKTDLLTVLKQKIFPGGGGVVTVKTGGILG